MGFNRVKKLKLALLLAIILPLQSFAAAPSCMQIDAALSQTHCAHAAANTVHHDCGTCCNVAATENVFMRWLAPRFVPPAPAVARIESAPSVTIDRLDRPPRVKIT